MTHWLLSFHPLCETVAGQRAVQVHGVPPFVDGSCRREPHLDTSLPTISQLCRLDKGPDLVKGNRIFYMTVKNPGHAGRGWALIAAIEIDRTFPTHEAAAAWFVAEGLALPSNCVVQGNGCLDLELTTGLPAQAGNPQQTWSQGGQAPRTIQEWDAHYQMRAKKCRRFAVGRHLLAPALWNPRFFEEELFAIFGGAVPNTQRARKISGPQFDALLALMTPDAALGAAA